MRTVVVELLLVLWMMRHSTGSGFRTAQRCLSLYMPRRMSSAENQFEPAPSLLHHVKSMLTSSLLTPKCCSSLGNSEQVVDRIMQSLLGNSNIQSNKEFLTQGTHVAKALKFNSKSTEILNGNLSLDHIVASYQRHVEINNGVFYTIQQQHNQLQNKTTSLSVENHAYADAAKIMGTKRWVNESNEWMGNFMLAFYRRNGARKSYINDLAEAHLADNGKPLPRSTRDALGKVLLRDLLCSFVDAPPRPIRVLDVGSCYNPLARSSVAPAFDITALDLCPAHQSVFKCDFLSLTVGPTGSAPIIENGSLVQLPAHSFDAVTMSLVLSYLPSPEQRLAMIKKAHQLLKRPPLVVDDPQRPHDSGLLLIVEKESIFSIRRASRATANVALSLSNSSSSGSEEPDLCSQWKSTISSQGLRLVKYSNMLMAKEEGRRIHAFVFKTSNPASASDRAINTSMWISQDFATSVTSAGLGMSEGGMGSSRQSQRTTKVQSSILPQRDAGTPSSLPIAICGGGLGGAAFALALRRRGLPFVVFEADSGFSARKQGYALTMQQGTAALKALGIAEQAAAAGIASLAHVSYDAQGALLGCYGVGARTASSAPQNLAQQQERLQSSRPRHNLHIPRQTLRQLLLNKLLSPRCSRTIEGHNNNEPSDQGESHVIELSHGPVEEAAKASTTGGPSVWCWNKRCVQIAALEDRVGVELRFDDGSSCPAAGIVGADGIYSRVRQLCVGEEAAASKLAPLRFLGLVVVLGICPLNALDPEVSFLSGNAAATGGDLSRLETSTTQRQWLDGKTRVFSMPFGDGRSVMWQLSFPLPEEKGRALARSSQAGVLLKALALERCERWHEPLVRMISATDPSLVSGHPVYDRDPPTPDIFGRGGPAGDLVTLLGDAAHPMSPFKGQGANQALLDATALARAVAGSEFGRRGPGRRSLGEAFRAYEMSMSERSITKVLKSREAASFLHSPAALNPMDVTRAAAAEMALQAGIEP